MGFLNWVATKTKKQGARGADYVKKVINAEEIEKNGAYISSLASSLAPSAGREETFENAYQRLKMTEDDLRQTYGFYKTRFVMFSGFLLLSVLLGVWFVMIRSSWSVFPMLGFSAICLSQMFNASFRAFQIRHRQLCDVQRWLRHPEQWWVSALPPSRSSSRALKPQSKTSSSKTMRK